MNAGTRNPDAERYIVTVRKLPESERSISHGYMDVLDFEDVHDETSAPIGAQVSWSADLDPDMVEHFERATNLIDLVRISDNGLGALRVTPDADPIRDNLVDLEKIVAEALDEATTLPAEKYYKTGRINDQQREGACTFFAATNFLNAEPIAGDYDSQYAFQGYYRTKEVDPFPGTNYDGSTVGAACKVLLERGKIESRVGNTQDEAVMERYFKGVGRHGLILSMPWLEGMYRPDARGFIRPTGRVVGRHAIYLYGWTRYGSWGLFNSWGRNFGSLGKAWLAAADRPKLRAGGVVEAHAPIQMAA